MKKYIKKLAIKECDECKEIRSLQLTHNINIAPLFWQGEGRTEIPLVLMGINPSVVGTDNEPKRDSDFDAYFTYYQDRNMSERESKNQAHKGGFARKIPTGYWTKCHKLAKHFIGEGTPRWKNYILMEAIHCFYNKNSHMREEDSRRVARRCFDKFIKHIFLFLKPKRIILLGTSPYVLLKPYLEREIDNYEYCSLQLEDLKVPVLRHPHPAAFGPFYKIDKYDEFKQYCSTF